MRKRELYEEVEHLRRINKELYEERDILYKKMLEYEKKSRKKILKGYDIAILIKDNKTYLLQKGEEEKTIRSFILSQDAGSYPVLEIEKVLY